MLERLEQQRRLTSNQWKLIITGNLADLLDFFDFFLIGYVLAFITKEWQLTYWTARAGIDSQRERPNQAGGKPLGIGAVVCAIAVGAAAQDSQRGAVEHFIGTVIRQTATVCPLTSPGDQAALDLCRSALYGDSAFRRGVAPVVLWGRPSPDGRRLRDTNLTQFAPDVLSGLYVPLFMFTGEYQIGFDPTERLYRARVPRLVPQRPGSRPVSVPVLARRQEMGGLSGGQRADALDRPRQGQGGDHAILRPGQA
jgi:hypothetical protein